MTKTSLKVKLYSKGNKMVEKESKALTGAEASAEAIKQINPDVMAAYPITPQTPVMHAFAKFVADGDVDTELICVDSEHSAMSATVGASAAGARAMTATASNGLALMHEIVYIASSNRLPIVMSIVNRALSAPINIHCDHSDTMAERDSGWLQFYSENPQEAYDLTILAQRVAEHPDVRLPVMVCQDGFICSHCVERVDVMPKDVVQNFVGEFHPNHPLLDVDNPISYGPLDLYDYYFEHKRQQSEAMMHARRAFEEISAEYANVVGKKYDFVENYNTDDADIVIVTMSSTAGTAKDVVDELREQGQKVGLLKITVFRPFPVSQIVDALKDKKIVGVLERSESFGAMGAAIFNEIRSAMYELKEKPHVIEYIYGLGGREMDPKTIKGVFQELDEMKNQEQIHEKVKYLGVRE
jgi:pyruvate ferredoxin oxidoreductase alpha subunit